MSTDRIAATVTQVTRNRPSIDANGIYEKFRPMIVWLGLTELGWIGLWLMSGVDNDTSTFAGIVAVWIVGMVAWLAMVIYTSRREFFLKYTQMLSNLVGFTIVVTFAVAVFGAIPTARHGLVTAARNTSDMQLIYIHILRLLAIGSVVKFFHRELPLHFVILGSLPDFLFAVSAVVLSVAGANGPLDPDFLIAWHLIGASVFFGAGFSMFFSVPSPLRIYHTRPDTSIVFRFPMVLAPNLTVPLFMIAHGFALVKLLAGQECR